MISSRGFSLCGPLHAIPTDSFFFLYTYSFPQLQQRQRPAFQVVFHKKRNASREFSAPSIGPPIFKSGVVSLQRHDMLLEVFYSTLHGVSSFLHVTSFSWKATTTISCCVDSGRSVTWILFVSAARGHPQNKHADCSGAHGHALHKSIVHGGENGQPLHKLVVCGELALGGVTLPDKLIRGEKKKKKNGLSVGRKWRRGVGGSKP